ncbi:FHA domain-containing protein [Microbacterium sp. RD1]|uniref:FHA domain-containing protein n=1 Tax=Microbacterium sp. RD1 TaxID=3457313 RepID=UPI003FA5AC57
MTTQESLRLADVDPLVLTTRARAGQIAGATLIDGVIPLALVASGVVAIVTGYIGLAVALLAVAAALGAATLVQVAHTGQSIGGRAVGVRTVKRSTGAAAGGGFLAAAFSRGLATFDLRRGRDPFAPALAPFQFPERLAQPPLPRRPARAGAPLVQLDSGQRLVLESALILGRNPSAPADAPAEVFQWPDLSRTLSKSHARLEWDGTRVWVTDLGSTNGTFVRTGTTSQPLLPHQRTPLPSPASLELGDRAVTVHDASWQEAS